MSWSSRIQRRFKNDKGSASGATPPSRPGVSQEVPQAPHLSDGEPNPHPHGIEIVAEAENANVDIVAVHGLNGHRERTWTAANGVHWLRDLLPIDITSARVMCWGYDANTHSFSGVGKYGLYEHAGALVTDLARKRAITDTQERPIIFIGHSLGGIVIKSALIHAAAAREGALEDHHLLKIATFGILFMGTPHQGGNGVQMGRLIGNVASVVMSTNLAMLEDIERGSSWLQQQLGQYAPISSDFVTKFCYEEYETPTALGHKLMVVPKVSAVIPGQQDAEQIMIHADHKNMVRFTSATDSNYRIVLELLQLMLRTAAGVVSSRFQNRQETRNARTENGRYSLSLSLPDATPVNYFVAREVELAKMHEILTVPDDRSTLVLSGLGGMGKTQLALAYINRNRDFYSAIIWMNATDESSLKQSFVKVAERVLHQHSSIGYLKAAVESKDIGDVVSAVKRWLDEPENGRWLLVYDNHDHPKMREGVRGGGKEESNCQHTPLDDHITEQLDNLVVEPFDIKPFLPDTIHGAILVTTRDSRLNLGQSIKLKKLLKLEESLKILETTSNRKNVHTDEGAKAVAKRLDGLPLALSTAGTYCHEGNSSTTWFEYLKAYDSSWVDLVENSPDVQGYDRTMYTTWLVSYKSIEKRNPHAAKLLRLWAYLDNGDLWYELLRPDLAEPQQMLLGLKLNLPPWLHILTDNKVDFDKAMRMLCDNGFALVNPTSRLAPGQSGGFSIHSCVHTWSAYVLKGKDSLELLQLSQPLIAACVPQSLEPYRVLLTSRLRPHADRCWQVHRTQARLQQNYDSVIFSIMNLFDQRPFIDYHRVESLLRDLIDSDSPLELRSILAPQELAKSYGDQGRFDEATTILLNLLNTVGETDESRLELHVTLACDLSHIYTRSRRFDEAEVVLDLVSERWKRLLVPTHPATIKLLMALQELYVHQGKLKDAENLLQAGLGSFETTLGQAHFSVLQICNRLGKVHMKQGQLNNAESLFRRVLEGYRALFDTKCVLVLSANTALCTLYAKQGRWVESLPLHEEVHRVIEETHGWQHMWMFKSAVSLIRLYCRVDEIVKGYKLLKRILDGLEPILGPEQLANAGGFLNLGAEQLKAGRLDNVKVAIVLGVRELMQLPPW